VFRFIPAAPPGPSPGPFAPLPRQPLTRGVFRSIVPEAALNCFLEPASRASIPAHGPPLPPDHHRERRARSGAKGRIRFAQSVYCDAGIKIIPLANQPGPP